MSMRNWRPPVGRSGGLSGECSLMRFARMWERDQASRTTRNELFDRCFSSIARTIVATDREPQRADGFKFPNWILYSGRTRFGQIPPFQVRKELRHHIVQPLA